MALGGIGLVTNALFAGLGAIDARNRGKRDARIANERFQLGRDLFGDARSALEQGINDAEPFFADMLDAARQSYTDQTALVNDIGDEGYRSINDAFTFGGARINQNFANRGFSGSSMQGNAFRGLASDVSRSFGNLTSQLAGVRSNVLRGALGDVMNALQANGQFQMGAGSNMANLYSQEAQFVGGVGHQPATGVAEGWGKVGGFFADALDSFIGGGAPAASGISAPSNVDGPPSPLFQN